MNEVRPIDVFCAVCWAEPSYRCEDEQGEDRPAHEARREAAREEAAESGLGQWVS